MFQEYGETLKFLSCRKCSFKIIVGVKVGRWYYEVGISSFVFWQLANNKEREKLKTQTPYSTKLEDG